MPKKDTEPKEEKHLNPESLGDLPGVGPVAEKKLNDEGYHTMLQVKAGLKIQEFIEITGMDREKAVEAYKSIEKTLNENNLLPKMMMSGRESYQQRLKVKRLLLHCKGFDHLFWHEDNQNDGIEYGTTTELYGEPGVGKTQMSHRLMMNFLLENKEKFVTYIDSEDTFRPERIIQFGKSEKMDMEKINDVLDRIVHIKVFNADMQIIAIQNIGEMLATKSMDIGMMVVDSGTALFREEFLKRGTTKTKSNMLNLFVHKFKNTAEAYNIPAIFVNQVYNSVDPEFGKNKWIPYGGNIVAHTHQYRIRLEKIGEGNNKRRATLVKSPIKGPDESLYKITESGIEDVSK